jgi:hypothetical protein
LEEVLYRHCSRVQLTVERRQAAERLDLSYRLLLRDPLRRDDLRFALEQSEGVEQLSLYMREDESEV